MSEAMRPVAWQYTTESGNEHYTAIKAKALQFDANPTPLYTAPPSTAEAQPRLTVRLLSFPESNGKRNWTAMIARADKWGGLIGNCGGITIARSELWNRVAYEAECAKLLIGERTTQPDILDYGDDIETPEEWKGEIRGGHEVVEAKRIREEAK